MAVNQLQLPTYATPQALDFTSLGQLGQVYQKAQQDQMRQQTLASLGQGGTADAQALLKSGDLSLAQLGIGLQNTEYQHGRDSKNDARSATNDAFSQQMERERLALARRSADRQDEGPLEKMRARLKVLEANGIDPASPEGRAYAIGGEWSGPGTGGASLTPVFGVGADGKPAMIQPTKSGVAIQTKVPEGFQISKEPIKIDTATGTSLLDPQTRQQIGFIPKNLAEAERQKATGDATGAAEVALPTVISNSQQILKTLDAVENHPGKKYALGMWSKAPTIPGTAQADFRANMDQLNGQTFLQAFQTLKGGGAITDIEGQKGSNAIARMQTAQSEESFNAAVRDFKDVVKSGMLRASAKARGPGSPTQGITQQQYEALPSGSPFTAPDGTQRVKP